MEREEGPSAEAIAKAHFAEQDRRAGMGCLYLFWFMCALFVLVVLVNVI